MVFVGPSRHVTEGFNGQSQIDRVGMDKGFSIVQSFQTLHMDTEYQNVT